ncbi:hypothetical protein PSRA_0593 [Pseudoscardovia radai]|uniref:DUF4125 domain-containing protein n=2 Tax=Pseudoscardovia radai TaxID=987066 RepID=A0A261EZV8_9BIFI|nr:hypothetical protein PSRA_0593 [Pseudoscardovia radai]
MTRWANGHRHDEKDDAFVSDFGGIGDEPDVLAHDAGADSGNAADAADMAKRISSKEKSSKSTAPDAPMPASPTPADASTPDDAASPRLDPDRRIGMPGGTPLVEAIVREEWKQFQDVNNEGGRAACQGNWPVFHQMRLSQFLTWPEDLKSSYLADLRGAAAEGRNLLTEKYARMMASTDPVYYRERLEPFLPAIGEARTAQQERIIARQVAWAADFAARYPRLGAGMRRLRTSDDTRDATSFETYLRGELGTYSQHTLDLYDAMIDDDVRLGRNLTELTIYNTVLLGGFASLDEAEHAQPAA